MRKALFALLAALPALARAEERPTIQPTRDVDVTYRMQGIDDQGHPRTLTQRTRWDVADGLLRVDPPRPDVYFIVQMHEHHLLAVRAAAKAVLLLEADTAAMVPGLGHATSFQRVGTDSVAGLPCTEWDTQDSGGQATTVCLTDDGVLLRARAGDKVLVEAASVAYAPADPTVFKVPEGFQTVRPAR